ncbi:hypothetical protein PORCELAIN_106 [Mycobacterium phage Porcelain]|nr:hypothetical protein PORCELAIN_106 [Mycobacterium phage Porcelain]
MNMELAIKIPIALAVGFLISIGLGSLGVPLVVTLLVCALAGIAIGMA